MHEGEHTFEPKAMNPMAGSADLCFITEMPIAQFLENLHHCGVVCLECLVNRAGAHSELLSIYSRDPNRNLIEVTNELFAF